MAYDRPSWREIDRKKDHTSGRRNKKKQENRSELREHSTRYERYKADLDRLFDQGMAGELLKQADKEAKAAKAEAQESNTRKTKTKAKGKTATTTRSKKASRIPKDTTKTANRLKLFRAVVDAQDTATVVAALDELVASFGLPDDWEILVRVLEHSDEKLIIEAIGKMKELLPKTTKIPRRFTLKERLRSIGQTAQSSQLRELAVSLEERL